MSLEVIGFYRRGKTAPSVYLIDPIFYILTKNGKKVKEYTLKLSGKYYYVTDISLRDFKEEEYKNYTLITNFLLGDNKERIRDSWGLTKEEYRDLIYGMYFLLVRNYSTCNLFKKGFLLLKGFIKYKLGRLK